MLFKEQWHLKILLYFFFSRILLHPSHLQFSSQYPVLVLVTLTLIFLLLLIINLSSIIGSGSRGWFRRLLNSTSPMDIPNLQLHTEQNPPKRDSETLSDSYILGEQDKNPHQNRWERLRHNLSINPTSNMTTYNQEGTHNSQFLPKEWRVWTPYLLPQLSDFTLRDGLSKQLPLKANGARVHKVHKATVICKTDLWGLHEPPS